MIRLGASLVLLLLAGGAVADDPVDRELLIRGERVFAYCYACHSVVPGEIEGLPGPNLVGIVGRPIAAQEGFDYSPAMRAFAEREGRWSEALLDSFLTDPEGVVRGTWMSAPPLDPEERSALIAYLKAVSPE